MKINANLVIIKETIKKLYSTLKKILEKKHSDQMHFCKNYGAAGYEIIVFQAELKSPLITGIGRLHPNEVGMAFDHVMGIPYIPSSSIKGIVRFAHILGLIDNGCSSEFIKSDQRGEYIDEKNKKTMIPYLFGGDQEREKNGQKEIQKLRGKVIFLDAYPENVPELHVDIMNPHYGAYYSDEEGAIPPADYLDPTPIQFLTVKPGTKFIFRVLVRKDYDLKKYIIKAYERALSIEGMGAKTAVGYGRFEIKTSLESANGLSDTKQIEPVAQDIKTPLEKMLDSLSLIKPSEIGRISGEIINKMDIMLESDDEKAAIARAIKEKISTNAFKKLDKKKNGYLSKLIEKS